MANGGRNLENGRDHYFDTPMYLLTRDPQPYCDDCFVPLTVRHLLVECSSLIELRHRYLYRCRGRDSGRRQMTADVAAPYFNALSSGAPTSLTPAGHASGTSCRPWITYRTHGHLDLPAVFSAAL
ncbi:hypothetical protein E2C01_054036 [Portunus trituberculatus]|uniref:Uncharacterized protein n=1 Tax=Portunus trituberculatus TaxID=210409 RepID=A0A5B7GIT4_PORTR|nr:hypothetical protein [Portunus trituberculatus]